MSKMTLGSLFDGSGGFPLGAMMNGIIPVWASEIEPFPIRVTSKRLPFMKHYGDVSTMRGDAVEPVDIITFGSPCTDLSVAGKRAGLEGEQSSLFHQAIRIIKEMREKTNGQYPKYIVWENVPGAFSSAKGQDFRKVLEEIVKIKDETASVPMPEKGKWLYAGEIVGDGYSLAWRTLDAQYFGVAQRRRRCYLVADFRGASAGQILFEFEGLSGYTPQSFGAWEGTPADAQNGTRKTGFDGYNGAVTGEVASTLGVNCGQSSGREGVIESVAVENHGQDSRYKIRDDGISQTLASNMGMGGNNVPLVMNERNFTGKVSAETAPSIIATDYKGPKCVFEPKVYGVCAKKSNSMMSDNPKSGFYEADTSRALDRSGGNPTCNQGGMAVVCLQGSMIGRKDKNGPQGSGINEDKSFTLNSVDKHAVVYAIDRPSFNAGQNYNRNMGIADDGLNSTLTSRGPSAVALPASFYPQMKAESQSFRSEKANTLVNGTNPGYQNGVVETTYAVRRLTPSECAVLQGFPWWWAKGLQTEEPSEDDITAWEQVFETHRKALSPKTKPKSRKQIKKWLENPESDSAEYKMWGNGVALPCVAFVMAGIAWCEENFYT